MNTTPTTADRIDQKARDLYRANPTRGRGVVELPGRPISFALAASLGTPEHRAAVTTATELVRGFSVQVAS
jgi:hypothetical protein